MDHLPSSQQREWLSLLQINKHPQGCYFERRSKMWHSGCHRIIGDVHCSFSTFFCQEELWQPLAVLVMCPQILRILPNPFESLHKGYFARWYWYGGPEPHISHVFVGHSSSYKNLFIMDGVHQMPINTQAHTPGLHEVLLPATRCTF